MGLKKNRGIAIITVSALLFVFLGFGSLVFDIGYLHIVKGELQNAADAGALAGAAVLYDNFGTSINPGANAVGEAAATTNNSQNLAVEVFDALSNNGDVQRGHWSFATRTFTPNASLAVTQLWGVSTAELDADTDFINAVRVRTRRENIPAYSILSKIYGHDSFQMHADAVAYIGFAGTLLPGEVDQPIAICQESILTDPLDPSSGLTCRRARMINSSGDAGTSNTAAWTNFTQTPCDTASVPTVRPLICAGNSTQTLTGGADMGTTGGMQDNVYRDLRDCWIAQAGADTNGDGVGDQIPEVPWNLRLPVVECPSNNPGPCSKLVGGVFVNVLYIKDSGSDPHWMDVPLRMATYPGAETPFDFVCSYQVGGVETPVGPNETTADLPDDVAREECWNDFVTHFNFLDMNNNLATGMSASDIQKLIVFAPDCTEHEITGTTGGTNFDVLAKIPVLVQ
jgi:hypothetical protein